MSYGLNRLRFRELLCPVLVLAFAVGIPMVVVRAPWPIEIRVQYRQVHPWSLTTEAESIFVARAVSVNGWINRTVTVDVTEVLKGEISQRVLEVEPGKVAGTESVGKLFLVYVPKLEHLTAGWRRDPGIHAATTRFHRALTVLHGAYPVSYYSSRSSHSWLDNLPVGVELIETDSPLDLRALHWPGPPVPRRLIQHQRDVLTIQAMKTPLTSEQVRILEDWLKPEFRNESPGPWLIRDLLRNYAWQDKEAARLLEKYEALPW